MSKKKLPPTYPQLFQWRQLLSPGERRGIDLCLKLEPEKGLKTMARESLEEIEKTIICYTMNNQRMNRTQMANYLKVDFKTLRSKLKKYELDF